MEELVKTAFEAGSGLSTLSLTAFAEVVLVGAAVMWSVWTAIGSYQLWHDGQANSLQLFGYCIRSAVVVFLLFFLFS